MKPMSPVLRLFFVNWSLGMALGFAFAAGILWFDLAGIHSLIRRSDIAVPAMLLLFGGFGFTFGGVVCGSAIMRLPRDEEPDRLSGPPVHADLVPAPVRARR